MIQRELLTCRRTYTDVARSAQLGISTVSNIASGQTRLPRLETVIRIFGALGWHISARRNPNTNPSGKE